MPKQYLTPAQKQALWQSKVNRTIGGMSPAHDVWSQAKKSSGFDSQTLKHMFNLNLGAEADHHYRVCKAVRDYMSEAGPATPEQKEHVKLHEKRVMGIVDAYKKRIDQRKGLGQ